MEFLVERVRNFKDHRSINRAHRASPALPLSPISSSSSSPSIENQQRSPQICTFSRAWNSPITSRQHESSSFMNFQRGKRTAPLFPLAVVHSVHKKTEGALIGRHGRLIGNFSHAREPSHADFCFVSHPPFLRLPALVRKESFSLSLALLLRVTEKQRERKNFYILISPQSENLNLK